MLWYSSCLWAFHICWSGPRGGKTNSLPSAWVPFSPRPVFQARPCVAGDGEGQDLADEGTGSPSACHGALRDDHGAWSTCQLPRRQGGRRASITIKPSDRVEICSQTVDLGMDKRRSTGIDSRTMTGPANGGLKGPDGALCKE